jgi:predicted RNA binding protein YcfA (HicA-like mRNA interferase family)
LVGVIDASLAHRRLRAQRLIGPTYTSVVDTVQSMGALQAQDYGQAIWAIGARTSGATWADVERAISERQIVRTWPMRGTIHFVPARDAAWMTALCTPRSIAVAARRQAQLGLDDAILARCGEILHAQLSSAPPMPRADVLSLLEQRGIATGSQRGYHILLHHAQRGLLCLGPMAGKQPTFVLLDAWVTERAQRSRDSALTELARRYFTSRGPASVHDFANWTNLPVADARAGLESVASELISDQLAGVTLWSSPSHRTIDDADVPALQLLPGFDEFLLGYKDRIALVTSANAERIAPGANGVIRPMLVERGEVTGTWRRKVRSRGIELSLEFFAPGKRRAKAVVERACERYAEFSGQALLSCTLEQA